MKLTVRLELTDSYLDLKYYKLGFTWQDKDTWIPDSIKILPNNTCVTLTASDILLKIIELCNNTEVNHLRFKIKKDEVLENNLRILTKQTKGKQFEVVQQLAPTPKEQKRLSQFFRSKLNIEVV